MELQWSYFFSPLFARASPVPSIQNLSQQILTSLFSIHSYLKALITRSKPHHRVVFESLRRSVEADDGDAYVEDYEKKLHEVNPPGLPFIAVGGKTQLIHLELKHPDWITVPKNTVTQPIASSAASGDETNGEPATVRLINFWKCRQIADLVEYYLSFQQTPYNFAVNEHIRVSDASCIFWLIGLCPFALETIFVGVVREKSRVYSHFYHDYSNLTDLLLNKTLVDGKSLPPVSLPPLTCWHFILFYATLSFRIMCSGPQLI